MLLLIDSQNKEKRKKLTKLRVLICLTYLTFILTTDMFLKNND